MRPQRSGGAFAKAGGPPTGRTEVEVGISDGVSHRERRRLPLRRRIVPSSSWRATGREWGTRDGVGVDAQPVWFRIRIPEIGLDAGVSCCAAAHGSSVSATLDAKGTEPNMRTHEPSGSPRRFWRTLVAVFLMSCANDGAGSEKAHRDAPDPPVADTRELDRLVFPPYWSWPPPSSLPASVPDCFRLAPALSRAGGGPPPDPGTPGRADGEWIQLLPPRLAGHTAIFDPHRQRMIVFGGEDGFTPRNDVLALPLEGEAVWERIEATGRGPGPRSGHVGVHDTRRRRLIVYGGENGERDIPGTTLGDLWALSLGEVQQWRPIHAEGPAPSPRRWARGIYDPIRDRVLILGGYLSGGVWSDELWELRLGGRPTWRLLRASGDSPGPLLFFSAIYDEANDQMVLFGGVRPNGASSQDVYALTLDDPPTWRRVQPAGSPPPTIDRHSAIYDAFEHRMLVYGGLLQNGAASSDVWSLTLGANVAWSKLEVGGVPLRLTGSSVMLDPARRRVIAYGGPLLSEVWEMKLETPSWTRFPGSFGSPPSRAAGAAFYDERRDRVVTYGTLHYIEGSLWRYGSPWALRLGSKPVWEPLQVPDDPELHLYRPWAFDPVGDRLLVFGDRARDLRTIWQMDLGDTPFWTPLRVVGDAPVLIGAPTWTFDPVRRKAFVFGLGESWRETWSLDVVGEPRWTRLAPENAPPWGIYRTPFMDPVRRRFLMFGGVSEGLEASSAIWSLDLDDPTKWRLLSTSGAAPSARNASCGVYDPTGDRLLLFGGGSFSGALEDLWELSLRDPPTWTRLTPRGTAPIARYWASAVYDSRRGRMVLLGGSGGFDIHDTWFLEWHPSSHGSSRDLALATSPRDGRSTAGQPSDLPFGGMATWPDASKGRVVELTDDGTSFGQASIRLALHLRAEADVRLSIWDVQGRLVRSERLGTHAAGTHRIEWRPIGRSGEPLTRGLYLVALEADRDRAVVKVFVAR